MTSTFDASIKRLRVIYALIAKKIIKGSSW
jgi:hypothetical protein